MKISELASLLHGEILGDGDIEITGVSGIREAKGGDVTFVSDRKFLKDISGCKASCLLVSEPVAGTEITQIKVSNPYLAFATLLEHFYAKPYTPVGISRDAIVSDKAEIGKDVSIFPFVHIAAGASVGDGTVIYPFVSIGEESVLGERCTIYPHVAVREKVRLGSRVIIHSGSVIGSDGFGYVFEEGSYHKIPQVGGVIIEDDVEIGSNVSIDRATLGNTLIGRGTKIDNLVQIGHNVTIGANSILVSQVGIAGSCEIGDYVTMAGQVGIADHLKIESGTKIGAKSGVMSNLAKGAYSGIPSMPHRHWLKVQAVLSKLPDLHKRLRALEERIKELERRDS